jgi:hypothetical protein
MTYEALYPTIERRLAIRLTLGAFLLAWVLAVCAQETSGAGSGNPESQAVPSKSTPQNNPVAQSSATRNGSKAELTIQDSGTAFKLNSNLVPV